MSYYTPDQISPSTTAATLVSINPNYDLEAQVQKIRGSLDSCAVARHSLNDKNILLHSEVENLRQRNSDLESKLTEFSVSSEKLDCAKEMRAQHDRYEQDLNIAIGRQMQAEGERDEALNQIQKMKYDMESLQKRILHAENAEDERARKAIAQLQRRLDQCGIQASKYSGEIANRLATEREMEGKIRQLETVIRKLELTTNSIPRLQKEFADLRGDLKLCREHSSQLVSRASLVELEEKLGHAVGTVQSCHGSYEELKAAAEQLRLNVNTLSQDREKFIRELGDTQKQVRECRTRTGELKEGYERDLVKARETLEGRSGEIRQQEAKISALENQLTRCRTKGEQMVLGMQSKVEDCSQISSRLFYSTVLSMKDRFHLADRDVENFIVQDADAAPNVEEAADKLRATRAALES